MKNIFKEIYDATVDHIAFRQPKLAECIRAARAQDDEIAEGWLMNCGEEKAAEDIEYFFKQAEELVKLPHDVFEIMQEYYEKEKGI